MIGYVVICNRTKERATRTVYKTRKAARRAADRLDLIYGAIGYSVKMIGDNNEQV